MKHDFNTLHLLWAIRNIPSNTLNSQEKIILFVLLSSTGSNNESWYSQSSLAEMCSLSESSIKRSLAKLVQKKFIDIKRPDQNHRIASNHYTLNIDQLMIYCPVEKESPQNPIIMERGSQGAAKGFTQSSRRGSQGATKKEREERKEEEKHVEGESMESSTRPHDGAVSTPVEEEHKVIPMPPHVRAQLEALWKNRITTNRHH